MKNPKKLTRKEKQILSSLGYNSKNFLRASKNVDGYEFLEVHTGKILSLRK